MQEYSKITLDNVGNGVAAELFEREFRQVMKNIADVNTNPTATREITLKVLIRPTADRKDGTLSVKCASKLAPVQPYATPIFFGQLAGEMEAYNHNFKQETLPMENVLPLKHEEKKHD